MHPWLPKNTLNVPVLSGQLCEDHTRPLVLVVHMLSLEEALSPMIRAEMAVEQVPPAEEVTMMT